MRTKQQSSHSSQQARHLALSLTTFLVITSLFAWLALARPVQAQAPTPLPPRDALKQAIEERAQRDVELGKLPESIAGLDVLFGDEAAAVGMSMSEVLDVYEQAYAAATPPKRWWEPLQPYITWGALVTLAVVAVHSLLKDYIIKFLKWLAEAIYKQLAGFKPFWWIGLRRYRQALVERYQKLKIPFRQGRPLDMRKVYVPLRAAETGDLEHVDAYQAISQHKRLVVTGAPGAGKTMLLKHIALTYAQGELALPTRHIPILIELNRLNASDAPLRDHLVEILKQNRFPRADSFSEAGLKHGRLLLLFDGLDEVNRAERERVVSQIKDLLLEHSDCRAVVTCRTAVYRDELADWTDQKLEIVEFSDQQIQGFLHSWEPYIPTGKSVEHLLRNLHERPRIMKLARNPLLLTIIAHLYADTPFVLPHSRAEFYKRSVTVLLEQWHEKRNRYNAAQKRLVLQHLALFNQDSPRLRDQDRRNIDLTTALEEVNKVLPSLNLKNEQAQPILNEIVERSGLLLSLDGGLKYQFAHLTLQEFFAAQALEADAAGLIERYRDDQDTWREAVRLWCGLDHDSTALIRELYHEDTVVAFECLGDARQVDADFADEIISAFETRLGEDGTSGEAVIQAFAVVATNPGPRGQRILDFLSSTSANTAASPERRLAAANALALSNLPQAADTLTEQVLDHPEIRPLLTQMGDLSVPALEAWARQGQTWAMDALREVGTPQAALALVPLLWYDDAMTPCQAAWQLAAMLLQPNIESALRMVDLTPEQRKAEQINWIWSPFDEPPASALPVIAGRIAHLLHTAPAGMIPPGLPPAFDPRLVIPLCAVAAQDDQLEEIKSDARNILIADANLCTHLLSAGSSDRGLSQRVCNGFVAEHVDKISTHPTWRYLFGGLPSMIQFNLLRRLVQNEPPPDAADWHSVLRPSSYIFETSWQARGVKLLLVFLGLANLWELVDVIRQGSQLWSWENVLAVLSGVAILVILWRLMRSKLALGTSRIVLFAFAFAVGVGPALGVIIWALSGNWLLGIVIGIVIGIVSGVAGGIGGGGGIGVVGGVGGIGAVVVGVGVAVAVAVGVDDGIIGISDNAIVTVAGAVVGIVVGVVIGSNSGIVRGITVGTAAGVAVGVVGAIGVAIGVVASVVLGTVVGGIVVGVVGTIVGSGDARGVSSIASGGIGGVFGLIDGLLMYLPTKLLYDAFGWPIAALLWILYLAGFGFLVWHGASQQRRAQNPLHGLLEGADDATSQPTA